MVSWGVGQGGMCFVPFLVFSGDSCFLKMKHFYNVQELFLTVSNKLQQKFRLLIEIKVKFWLLTVCPKDTTVCQVQPNMGLSLDFKSFIY